VNERLTYTFGPLERRGLVGPLRGGQIGLLAAGALGAILILDHAPTVDGALVAMIVFVVAAGLAFLPVGGRACEEWAPVMMRFLARAASGRARFRSPLPRIGMRVSPRTELIGPDAAVPRELHGVAIRELAYRERAIGALSEQSGRRLTAVLACRVLAFSLLDPEAQERRLARWGLVLSGASGGAVRRLQWIERTAPSQGDELARWLHAERDPSVPLRGTPMIESYLELIGTTAQVTQEHEILVAVQIDARRVRGRGSEEAGETLVQATERVAKGLEAAEVKVIGALGASQLARVLRTAFDPYARTELAALEAADPGRGGLHAAAAWPLAAQEGWEEHRTDGALHATYWIAGWPRSGVSPMFMDALLGRSSAVRAVSVTFEPLALERSTREVEAAITRDRADRELRARFGQSETARQRQARDATARREAELAAGHGEVRLSGFVTVSGRDPDDLRRSCAEVLDHAARSHLELRRLYGQQAEAFTFTLPLCRGLQ
jgi:hypothetical protein